MSAGRFRFYTLTAEGRTLWLRRDQVSLPPDYRRILGTVQCCGFKEVIRSRLARYPEPAVERWLKEFEAINLIEASWADAPSLLELRGNAGTHTCEVEEGDVAADARYADMSLSRMGAYIAHERVANRVPVRKPASFLTVLIVEDDPDQLALAMLRLTSAGYKVRTADSVGGLLDALRQRAPDALLLDVMLPDGDGFEVLAMLREHPAYARLPIVMCTAKTEPADIAKGLALGADAYVTKPYGASTLGYALRSVLQHELPEAAPVIAPVAEKPKAPPPEPAPRREAAPASKPRTDRKELDALLAQLAMQRESGEVRTAARWRGTKRILLLACLAAAILQYCFMDALSQIVALQPVPIFIAQPSERT